MKSVAKLLRIRGKVQGVMFRESMRKEAERLALGGWVRNRSDSSVEAFIQGAPEKVAELIQWAEQGPPLAVVNTVTVEDGKPDPELKSFKRRETI
jgi:acylphosphatase